MRLFLLATCIFPSFYSNAQITVNQNDFASAGKTVYLSTGQNNPFLNITATGANSTWDFSTLRSTGQQQIDYLNVSGTNIVYALYYADIFFNPNRSNIALAGSDIPFNQALGITNPYTFYYKNQNMYKKVGYGGEVAGLPAPLALTTPDTIYRFPMNYGNIHTTRSDYTVSLPGVLTSVYSQTRTTTIDGWGTLTTPYGTFDVLRSKSEVLGNDSIYADSLGFGVNIPRSKRTEYKWIAKNEDVPILQINTSTVFGIEIISQILFKDNRLFIRADSITGILCPGSDISVYYTASGTFNAPALLQQGNRFTAQLSNSNGSFANPRNIGNVTATASGSINATIPNNVTGGTGYLLRIVSNSPADTSASFGPFTITPRPTASITANGATTICVYDSVELAANSGSGLQYQWQLNGADISGATAQNYYASAAGDYTVAVSNICGSVTSQALPVAEAPEAVHTVTPTDTSTCDGSPILVTASNTSGVTPVTYQWMESGNVISGATDTTLLVTATGNYSLVVTDGMGCTFTTALLALEIDSMPIPQVRASGSTSFCPGESVTLTTDTAAGFSYRWQRNGTDIPGATGFSYVAATGGDYAVIVSDTCDDALSQIIPITVNARPVHTVTPSSPASCDGSPITIVAVNTSGASPVTYQWYDSGNAIPGATDTAITISAGGSYSLVVTDRTGCTFHSGDIAIVFDSLPIPVIYADGSTSFCFGESVTLTTDTNGQLAYQWLLDGAPLSGATDYRHIATEGGNYSVEISLGSACTAVSDIKKVNVYPQPAPPVISQSGDTLISTEAEGYQWYLGGRPVPGGTSRTFHPEENGSYTVEITDAAGCTNVSASYDYMRTGIDETEIMGVTVIPNPVVGSEFSIHCSAPFFEIQILNTAGAILIKKHLEAAVHDLRMKDLNAGSGVYLIKVKSEKGLSVIKLVKM